MRKNYFLWLILSVLGLAGCGRSERTSATGSPSTAAGAGPAPLAASKAPLPAAPGVAPAAMPAPPPAAADAETTRLLALLDGPRRRRPTTLATATPDTLAEASPDSVGTAELRSFLLAGLPPAQVFTVQPGRDTLLLGAQGTQVLVPADAFDLPPMAGPVRLDLQEFYTPADMVLAGLSTMAGSRLLETGGMLHLAASANGQPVALRPGRRLALRLPARQAQPDMQLFEGVAHGTSRPLDWQLPAAQPPADLLLGSGRPNADQQRRGRSRADSLAKPRVLTQWPQNKAFEPELRAQLRLLVLGQRRLHRSPFAGPDTRHTLAALSKRYEQPIVRQLQLRFTLDSVGVLRKAEVLPGSDSQLGSLAMAAVQRLERWQPARLPAFAKALPVGEPTPAVGRVSIVLTKKHGFIFDKMRWSLPRAEWPHARQLRKTVDSLLASPSFRRRYWHAQDSLAYLRLLATQQRVAANQASLRTQFTDGSQATITEDGVYNELRTQGLGWINCDRFARMRNIFVYRVLANTQGAVVSLVFKEMNSVVSGQPLNERLTHFANVPYGHSATVVALRRENGVLYLAKHEVHLDNEPLLALDFRPVTVAELRAALKR